MSDMKNVRMVEADPVINLLREIVLNIHNDNIDIREACTTVSYLIEDFVHHHKLDWTEPTFEEFEYYAFPDEYDEDIDEEEPEDEAGNA